MRTAGQPSGQGSWDLTAARTAGASCGDAATAGGRVKQQQCPVHLQLGIVHAFGGGSAGARGSDSQPKRTMRAVHPAFPLDIGLCQITITRGPGGIGEPLGLRRFPEFKFRHFDPTVILPEGESQRCSVLSIGSTPSRQTAASLRAAVQTGSGLPDRRLQVPRNARKTIPVLYSASN
jgi:hypothetical protein